MMNLRSITIRQTWFTTAWFWCFTYPLHRWLQCPFGRHQQLLMYITDGRTTVMPCVFCDMEREPTQEEVAAHPNLSHTPEQLKARDARIEASMQLLRDMGYVSEGQGDSSA
jgi:hypothetical protein